MLFWNLGLNKLKFTFNITSSNPDLSDANLGIFKFNANNKQKTFLRRLFPWKGWPIIEKACITFSMLCIIRLLYFIPLKGIDIYKVPDDIELSTPEQKLLAKMFMAGDSIPLNIALLGIGPMIVSNIFLSGLLNTNGSEAIPGPTRDMVIKHKLGITSTYDVERFSFKIALIVGTCIGTLRATALKPFAIGIQKGFVVRTVLDMLVAMAITRHCCNIIHDYGFGEGTGFLILSITLSGFGQTLLLIIKKIIDKQVEPWKVFIIFITYTIIVIMCVTLNQAQLRLPLVDYSMKSIQKNVLKDGKYRYISDMNVDKDNTNNNSVSNKTYLPLQISEGAVSGLFFCSSIFSIIDNMLSKLPLYLSWMQSWLARSLLFGFITFLFSILPFGHANPNSISEFLNRVQLSVKGKIPGEQTVKYLKAKLYHARLSGGIILFVISVMSLWLDSQSQKWLGTSVGTLNLILLVAVIISTSRTIESLMEGLKLEQTMKKERDIMNMF